MIRYREYLPKFDRLWIDYAQEETGLNPEEYKTPIMMTIKILLLMQRDVEEIE